MRCPNCETENRENARFCDQCGFPLTGAIAKAASEALSGEIDAITEPAESVDDDSPGQETGFIPAEDDEAEEPEAAGEFGSVDDAAEDNAEDAVAEDVDDGDDASDGPEAVYDEYVDDDVTADGSEASIGDMDEDVELPPVSAYEDVFAFEDQVTQAIAVDLSGFDRSYDSGERLVDPGYKEPTVDYRDGGTMKMPRIEGEEPAKSHDYLESSKKTRSKRPKIIAGIVTGVVILAAVVAFATYQMQLWGGIAVPNVIGMTEADATSVLVDEGFTVRSMQVKSDDTEGLVLVMDPDAGSRAEEGSEVIIHISTARSVPSVVDKTQEEAAQAMEEEGFTNVVYEKEFSDKPEGTVLSLTPEAGTRAKSAQEIIVKVAEPYVVPDIAGMYLQEAQTTIEEAGLSYDYQYVNTVDYPDGQIMGSSPAAGTQVTSDTIVIIQIARARGAELEGLTRSYLAPGSSVTIGFNNYAIESLDSVEYIGDDAVAFTMTARPFTYILGETVSISARQISGVIVWNDDNTIAGIS